MTASTGQADAPLSPTGVREIAARLPADLNLLAVEATDSTNRLARSLVGRLREDRVPIVAVVANRQSAGRGRSGRRWQSEAGAGIWATWMGVIEAGRLPSLPSRVGVELCIAAGDLKVDGIGLKWPNDVLRSGRKLAGVLCQSLRRGGSTVALCGVGVNLTTPTGDLASSTVGLRQVGFSGDRCDAVVACLNAVDRAARGSRPDWHRLLQRYSVHQVGDSLSWHDGAAVRSGRFLGFDDRGRLRLDTDGREQVLASGEID